MPKSVVLMLNYSKSFMSPNITAQYNPQELNNNSCSTSQIDAPKSNFIVSAAVLKQKNTCCCIRAVTVTLCNANYVTTNIHCQQDCPTAIRSRDRILQFLNNPQRNTMLIDILKYQANRNNKNPSKFFSTHEPINMINEPQQNIVSQHLMLLPQGTRIVSVCFL